MREISHHDSGVESALCHFLKVYKSLWLAAVKPYALWELHRRVAMSVEGEDGVVEAFGLAEQYSLSYEPFEYGQAFLHTLRMPLYSHYRLELAAFYGFHHSVGSLGSDAEFFSCIVNGLMVEGVDIDGVGAIDVVKNGRRKEADSVCRLAAFCVLAMLYPVGIERDVLLHMSVECHCQCLYSAADAENGYLSVVSQTCDKKFRKVTLAVY